MKNAKFFILHFVLAKLSHEDSNLDKQNQNLSYYLYTMGQRECKSKGSQLKFQKRNW